MSEPQRHRQHPGSSPANAFLASGSPAYLATATVPVHRRCRVPTIRRRQRTGEDDGGVRSGTARAIPLAFRRPDPTTSPSAPTSGSTRVRSSTAAASTARLGYCASRRPGPTERLTGRTLRGDAGQRVQGFLAKLGLTRSYLCLNAFAYALFPSHGCRPGAHDPPVTHLAPWRNGVFDLARVARSSRGHRVGSPAREALDLWPGRAGLTVVKIPTPPAVARDAPGRRWRGRRRTICARSCRPIPTAPCPRQLRREVPGGDYAPIPRHDLRRRTVSAGRRRRGRHAAPRNRHSVSRPSPDDRHALIWRAPET